jgi:hypothetical protein
LKQIGEHADDSALYTNVLDKKSEESDEDSLIPNSVDLPNIEDEMDDDELEIEPKMNPNLLTQGLEYKAKHFKNSSDSSDEDSIISGLDFSKTEHTTVDYAHPLSQSTPAPMLALHTQSLLENLMKSTGSIPNPHSSQTKYLTTSSDEDDSDFEILDKDEL